MKKLSIIMLLVCLVCYDLMARQRHIVVVGGGLAGLSAAIEAYRNGAQVLLLDKESRIGGNSIKASSGINAAGTPPQKRKKICDAFMLFAEDTIKSGRGYSNGKLVELLAQQSRDAWQFLSDLGVNLEVVAKTGGHSIARTHRAQSQDKKRVTNIGMDIIHTFSRYVQACVPEITVVANAQVKQLIYDDHVDSHCGSIIGVQYERDGVMQAVYADAVILATGGYCGQTGQNSLLARCRPDLVRLSTTNGACASGDGIGLACAVGAALVDMEKVQVHPTGFVHPHSPNELRKFLAPESLRASGAILLNHEGKRFTNELGKRDEVTNDILQHCTPYRSYDEEGPITAYLVLNEDGAQLFQKKVFDFYQNRGFIQTVADAEALAELVKVDSDVVAQTLQSYTASKQKGHDEFDKTVFPITFKLDEPLYVMLVTPCLHYTMGGVKFDAQARVLGKNGPIKNLYAAGEVTGGIHGANRLCGNSLLECVVFGRIAGKNAAKLN